MNDGMRKIRKLARKELWDYEEELEKLKFLYEKELEYIRKAHKERMREIQSKCTHPEFSRWELRLNSYNNIMLSDRGIPYRFRECLYCGLLEVEEAVGCIIEDIPFE